MQDKKIIDLAYQIMLEEDEIIVPVFKLYELMQQELLKKLPEINELINILSKDDRFTVFESKSTQEPWSKEEDEEMMKLGYYHGPQIMLKEKTPEQEEMQQVILEKMQKTLDSLKNMYQVKPADMSDEEEQEFIHVMSKAKDLQKKLTDAFNKKQDE